MGTVYVYENIWDPQIGKELPCVREIGNREDPFAVAVKKDDIVGHLQQSTQSLMMGLWY